MLRTAELQQLSSRDFLTNLRLKLDLDEAATAKVQRDNSNREGPIPNLPQLVEQAKEKFVAEARSYIVFLLGKILRHISLNADIVRVMACFDPHVLLNLPQQASFCFVTLSRNFSLRGWLEGSTKDDCRDGCLEFLGHFRQINSCLKNSPGGFTGMVAFGRNSFFKTMHAKYKSITQKSKSLSSSRSASGPSSPNNTSRRTKSPGAAKQKVMFDSADPAEEDVAQGKFEQSTSKS